MENAGVYSTPNSDLREELAPPHSARQRRGAKVVTGESEVLCSQREKVVGIAEEEGSSAAAG